MLGERSYAIDLARLAGATESRIVRDSPRPLDFTPGFVGKRSHGDF
jgi:hypothetical protein